MYDINSIFAYHMEEIILLGTLHDWASIASNVSCYY